MKALILATNYNSLAVKMIIKSLDKRGIYYDILNPSQLFLMISNKHVGRDQVFDDYKGETIKKIDLQQYDIVIPRIGKNIDFSCEVLKYLEQVFNMKTIQTSESISNAFSKIRTSILLRAKNIRTPKTIYVNHLKNVEMVLNNLSKNNKYVIKLDKGSKGKQVSIVSGIAETKSVLDTLDSMNQQIIIQEFIDSNGTDIRAIVIGDEVVASYKRKSSGNELRANISTGGKGFKITLTEEEKEFCIQCAKAVGLEFAGVDFIKSKKGDFYCIEVNHCPGMNVQKYSAINIMDKLIELVVSTINSPVFNNINRHQVDLNKVYNSTYNNAAFKKLYNELKGKLVQSECGSFNAVIHTKDDLQRLLVSQIRIN